MSRPIPTNTFLHEAEDLLAQIEEITLEVRPGDPAGEPVHHLFRAFHTIKGSGAMFGFDAVAEFTHHVETVLDKVRDGSLPISEELINLVLASKDQIKALLDAAQSGTAVPPETGEKLVKALNGLLTGEPTVAGASQGALPAATTAGDGAAVSASSDPLQTYRIRFKPGPGLMASGTSPAMLLNELRALGQGLVSADPGGIVPLAQLQPDQCYLAWDITLTTAKGLNAIKDVFIFVEDESQISIQTEGAAAHSRTASVQEAGTTLGAGPRKTEPVAAGQLPDDGRGARPAKEYEENRHPTASAASSSPSETPPSASRTLAAKNSTIRVPSERLDWLVALVGEMVMNQSRLTQVAAGVNVPNLNASVEELERLVDELRDNVLGIRMMPIGTTFNRYKRLVHDLSAESGQGD